MKRLVIDLDGTLTIDSAGTGYPDKAPNHEVIAKLRTYRAAGFEIVIHTSRNMRTYGGVVGRINVHTLPGIIEWLDLHDVPYDEVVVGKPWCGTEGFYVDDRSIRPSEFARLSPEEIKRLLEAESAAEVEA